MTRVPQTTGDTYADIVTWKWNRSRMRWTTKLIDGTEIVVQREMKRRRALWSYQITHQNWSVATTRLFDSATQAEEAALETWRQHK